MRHAKLFGIRIVKTIKKLDGNIFITTISTITAIVSVIIAIKSLQLAAEANQLSLASQSPKVQIQPDFIMYRGETDNFKDPCRSNFGEGVIWYIETASSFDVTNSGGKAISVVGLSGNVINPLNKGILAYVTFDIFSSRTNFEEWLSIRPSSTPLLVSPFSSFEFSGFPRLINPGETIRFFLLGKHFASFDETIYKNPSDIQKVLDNSEWAVPVTFRFGNNTEISDSILVPYPYQSSLESIPKEFKQCDQ